MTIEEQARQRWAQLMGGGGAQDRTPGTSVAADLPAPDGVSAVAGRGQVTVSWSPVPGAIGYAVHRSASREGPFEVVDHGGGDVLAVPHGPYADTTPAHGGWYAVAALQTVNAIGPLSAPVPVTAPPVTRPPGGALPGGGAPPGGGPPDLSGKSGEVTVELGEGTAPLPRIWQEMVGSEHLSHLLSPDLTGGRPIGPELREALRRVHDDLGIRSVRAHAILGDDLGVYREHENTPEYHFDRVDQVYDTVLDLGMTPVVEFGYMPRDLAADPSRTVFTYRGGISPPKDWSRWHDLIRAFTAHLADRYGLDELRSRWRFEVWNEPNLSVFWSGTPADYWRLYRLTAHAVKSVDPALRVGGPATAAVGWIDDQVRADAPTDFLSTHVYGTLPLDLRPWAGGRPILWTEWGVTATHGSPLNDSVFAAAFLLKGMHSAAGRLDALAPWVASDHFEELGRPPRLWHGGFGLLTVGNLAKPKFWALWLAQRLGDTQLPVTLTGDGAGSLVEAWASRYPDGGLGLLLWNSTLDHGKVTGNAALARLIRFTPPLPTPHTLRLWRIDTDHGNPATHWHGADWPTPQEWTDLHAGDRLDEAQPPRRVTPGEELVLALPNPGIAFLELRPEEPTA
ncbi:GH39 family glycosyl hydrolase [Actinoplanes subtropicus]|uniref:GH39 family glycosyl hydrolase n=1 Tax=Actinoplanes subtropicus TaxID=543632 RepID=UPI0005529CB3|nr:xylan 1,4-beta-xylosidase [Actinoplanes subtropicus]